MENKEKAQPRVQKSMYIPLWLYNQIDQLAKQKNKSFNEIIIAMLTEYFEQDPDEIK